MGSCLLMSPRFAEIDIAPGSATVFPQGAIHFEMNPSCEEAMFVAGFNGEDPGVNQVAQRCAFMLCYIGSGSYLHFPQTSVSRRTSLARPSAVLVSSKSLISRRSSPTTLSLASTSAFSAAASHALASQRLSASPASPQTLSLPASHQAMYSPFPSRPRRLQQLPRSSLGPRPRLQQIALRPRLLVPRRSAGRSSFASTPSLCSSPSAARHCARTSSAMV
jgi:hypothetical protein